MAVGDFLGASSKKTGTQRCKCVTTHVVGTPVLYRLSVPQLCVLTVTEHVSYSLVELIEMF